METLQIQDDVTNSTATTSFITPQKTRRVTNLPPSTNSPSKRRASLAVFVPPKKNIDRSIYRQCSVLLDKRYKELKRQPYELFTYFFPTILICSFVILLYSVYPIASKGRFDGNLEEYFLPFISWVYISKTSVYLVHEKPIKLRMKQMGLYEISYWISTFITECLCIAVVTAFMCAIISLCGLFNKGHFLYILVYIGAYYFSAASFSAFVSTLSDSTQIVTELATLILVGFFGVFYGMDLPHQSHFTQLFCCLFPQLALQLGARSFTENYNGVPLSNIIAILIIDIFAYALAAWYCNQVLPSRFNTIQPFYFPLQLSYWFPAQYAPTVLLSTNEIESIYVKQHIEEVLDTSLLGRPNVISSSLGKIYTNSLLGRVLGLGTEASGGGCAELSISLYEGQIFALLGRNGSGKSTALNLLSGSVSPSVGTARIYENSLINQITQIQGIIGVCPQETSFFDKMSVAEHVSLFYQLKGPPNLEEQSLLLHSVGLAGREEHRPEELSESERKKLALVLAFCGDSKFILLDAPFYGLDLNSKRQIWKFLNEMKKSRTIIITAQNVDDVDAVADRVAILDKGRIICSGSPDFLRNHYSISLKFVVEVIKQSNFESHSLEISEFVQRKVPGSRLEKKIYGSFSNQLIFVFPEISDRGVLLPFLSTFEKAFLKSKKLVLNFDLVRPHMSDVFSIAVPHEDIQPGKALELMTDDYIFDAQGGKDVNQNKNPWFQAVYVVMLRKLLYSIRDYTAFISMIFQYAIFLLASGMAYNITEFNPEYNSKAMRFNAIICGLYVVAHIMVPGNIAHFLVKDRQEGTKHLLLLAGCPIGAYWIGNIFADILIQSLSLAGLFATWTFTSMQALWPTAVESWDSCITMIIFNFHLIGFSYLFSFIFSKVSSSSAYLPLFLMIVLFFAAFILLSVAAVSDADQFFGYLSSREAVGILLWVVSLLSPHGAMFSALLNTVSSEEMQTYLKSSPSALQGWIIMAASFVIMFSLVVYIDRSHLLGKRIRTQVDTEYTDFELNKEDKKKKEKSGIKSEYLRVQNYKDYLDNKKEKTTADHDVKPYLQPHEVDAVHREIKEYLPGLKTTNYDQKEDIESGQIRTTSLNHNPSAISICIDNLRVRYPPKQRMMASKGANDRGMVAGVNGVSLAINRGEIFGLLGSNGSGKSAIFSSQLRHLRSEFYHGDLNGDLLIDGISLFDDLSQIVSKRLGYVSERDVLWDWMTSEEHLLFFARMGGLFPDNQAVTKAVDSILKDFELFELRRVKSKHLSTGNRKKLSLAIALIINPRVLFLESISDYLDPWSKLRVYAILQKSMSSRTSIVATNDVEDAEILCSRIGLLMDGQLKACGSKHDIKKEFAFGWVLTIKLFGKTEESGRRNNMDDQMKALSDLVRDLFRSAAVLSINYDSISFGIDKKELDIRKLQLYIESHHTNIYVENISLLHPTLEQVYFRIVHGEREGTRAFSKYLEESCNHFMIQSGYDKKTDVLLGDISFSPIAAKIDEGVSETINCMEDVKKWVAQHLTCAPCEGIQNILEDAEISVCTLLNSFGNLETGCIRQNVLSDEQIDNLIYQGEAIDKAEFLVRLITYKVISLKRNIDRKKDLDPWVHVFYGAAEGNRLLNRDQLKHWMAEQNKMYDSYSAVIQENHHHHHII